MADLCIFLFSLACNFHCINHVIRCILDLADMALNASSSLHHFIMCIVHFVDFFFWISFT